MNKPTNDYEALVLALRLSITADTDEQFNRALDNGMRALQQNLPTLK